MKNNRLGVYEDLPEEEYHADDALGSTDIKTLSQSTEKFFYRKNTPDSFSSTSSLVLGSAIHSLILDGFEEFFRKFKIRKKPRGKEFMGTGNSILTKEDWKKIAIWYRKLKNHPASKEILENKNIKTELSYFWEQEGVRYKCRFDILINNRLIVDLKTIQNPYDNFDKGLNLHIAKYRYHLQAQHYLNGLKSMQKELSIDKSPMFVFLFIEKSLPFRVGRKILAEDILSTAQQEIEAAITKYQEAKDNNYWVDPVIESITLDDMPAYF
jgi:exodeoxyribonuclease VIII